MFKFNPFKSVSRESLTIELKDDQDRSRRRPFYSGRVIILTLMVASATFLPQILFEIKYQQLMTKSVIAYVQDASQKVPLITIWQQRPLQMAETMYQRLFGVAPGSPIFFVLILMLLMWTVT